MLFTLIIYILVSVGALFLGTQLIRRRLEQEEELNRILRYHTLTPEEFDATLRMRIRNYLIVSVPFVILCGIGIFYDTIPK